MNSISVLLYIVALLALAYTAGHLFGFFIKHGRLAATEGTVYSISLNSTKRARPHSKWGKVQYKVKGKKYISQDLVQIPDTAEIGTKVTVRYDTEFPEKIYKFSWLPIIIALAVAVVCAVVGTVL